MIDPGRVTRLELPGPAIEGEARRPAQSYWNESWERLRANRIGVFCGILILALALIAIAAPAFSQFVTHFDPTRQHLSDNFRVPGHPYTTIFFTAVCWAVVAGTVYSYPRNTVIGLGIVLAGIPIYFFWRWWRRNG